MRRLPLLLTLGVVLGGCRGSNWQAGPAALVNSRQVAAALDDPVELEKKFDRSAVPELPAPERLRPCCAFGEDMKAALGPLPIPFFQKENIKGAEELGQHGYNNGGGSVNTDGHRGAVINESNGLVFTCRGGFIDTAHVRDNGDLTLYLAMSLLRTLPAASTILLPNDGARRTVLVKALPEGMLSRHGRIPTAVAMAQWIAFQLSIWHEISTWYGHENVKGFSEKVSAFSPEDVYSNALGILIAGGIIRNQATWSREAYERSMDAWILESLRRLDAQPREVGRGAIKALDGQWWDSSKPLTDWAMVIRRNLETALPLSPWTPGSAGEKVKLCAAAPPLLSLDVPERVGRTAISELVDIELTFVDWRPDATFPLPAEPGQKVTAADLPKIVAAIRREGVKIFGEGFDRPASAR